MFKGINRIVALTVAAILVVAIASAAYISSSSQPSDVKLAASGDPGAKLRITLDPQNFQGTVREAYEVAEKDPALLAQLHCYCGCDVTDGHKNLLDCFRDTHGSTCAICCGEARDAESMASRGMPIEQIRDALRARYAHGS
ncbi:MAG: CYCXC family (seleno)protein [Candidatus Binatus sp.]|uniref:CYCXC family (seleno)protein n=1 Tax=Candidatus Binatus sp. TaxID=2811406 RepID=UPI003BAFE911